MTSPSPRNDRAGLRRRHLLDVARALFVEQGFHQTGIAQIAAESGIKVGQMYRDFESKEAIIAAICEEDVSAWLEEDVLARAVAANDLHAIRAWVDRFGKQDDPIDQCRLLTEIIAEAGRNTRVAEMYHRADTRVRTSLSAALTALTPPGVGAEDVESVVELILALGAGAVCRRIANPGRPAGLVDQVFRAAIMRELGPLTRSPGGRDPVADRAVATVPASSSGIT